MTAMKLAWRQVKRLGALPGMVSDVYETSLQPVWQPGSEVWRASFRIGRFTGRIWRGLVERKRRIVYRAVLPAAPRPNRPRILHVLPNIYVGGSTQLIYDLCNALGDRYDMAILTIALPKAGIHQGVPIHLVKFNATTVEIARTMRAARPDLIHIHYWGASDKPWYEAALAAAKTLNVPLIQNVNTPVAPLDDPAIAETVFVSDYVRQTFAPQLTRARVIHPGIDLHRFDDIGWLDLHAGDSVGMVYRLEPDKLNDATIETLIAICRKRPRTRVVMIGDGSLFRPFVARTRAASVRDQFFFAGAVPYETLPDYYRLFRVFIAPVWQESFGQVTPFAMSMGLAVAGHRVGALPEILHTDETLGEPGDDSAAHAVALLDDPTRLEMIGARNRAIARAHYDVGAMNAAYDTVYRAALTVTVS